MSTQAAAAWARQRERSNLHALTLMRWIAVLLGRRVARWFLHPITLYFTVFGRSAVRASAQYLERLHGRPSRWLERYRHLHCFAATVLDRVYLLRGEFSAFDVRASGGEHYDAVARDGHGVLFVGAHLGSFEALRALGEDRRGLRVAMVMYEDNARQINAALRAVAPDVEFNVIGLGRVDSMLQLRHWLDHGGVAGLLADRAPPVPRRTPGNPAATRSGIVRLPFLGHPATFSDGPFRLAALLRRPMVMMAGLYRGGNRYDLHFLPVADFTTLRRGSAGAAAIEAAVQAAIERYVASLEALCREAPYNWFNFYDYWAEASPNAPGESPHAGAAASRNGTPP